VVKMAWNNDYEKYHTPLVVEKQAAIEVIECKCGEELNTANRTSIPDDSQSDLFLVCPKCERVYMSICGHRTGQETCFQLQGYECVWCDGLTEKLYKTRRDDSKAHQCEACVRKDIERMPKKIEDWQEILNFAREQLGGVDKRVVRFQVMSTDDLIKQKILNYTYYKKEKELYDDFHWVLVEFDDENKPLRILGEDGGEPEDQKLVRDWKWVADELNKLADSERELNNRLLENTE